MNAIAFLLCVVSLTASASEQILDRAPIDPRDTVSIQRGARTFVNYCMGCHSAEAMRYNRLEDLGLNEQQIKDNLMFTTDKVGETMTVAMRHKDAKAWFGIAPPDLSVIARARGPDWLYTYLRTFYRDVSRETGWNNLTFPNVGMPHVLFELQGQQSLTDNAEQEHSNAEQEHSEGPRLKLDVPGKLSPSDYDKLAADLVNYLVFMSEPARETRIRIGYVVLMFLGVLFIPVYLLKKQYWTNIH